MKVLLVIFHFIASANAVIEPPKVVGDIIDLKVSKLMNCFIDESGINCWGNLNDESFREIKNPISLALGGLHGCSINREIDQRGSIRKISCWGDDTFGQLDVPSEIVDPYMVVSGDFFTCAAHASGLSCWGFGPVVNQFESLPKFEKIYWIEARDNTFCVLHNKGYQCIGQRVSSKTESFRPGTKILIAKKTFIIRFNKEEILIGEDLKESEKIMTGSIVNRKVKFFGQEEETPAEFYSSSSYHFCFYNDLGLECVGKAPYSLAPVNIPKGVATLVGLIPNIYHDFVDIYERFLSSENEEERFVAIYSMYHFIEKMEIDDIREKHVPIVREKLISAEKSLNRRPFYLSKKGKLSSVEMILSLLRLVDFAVLKDIDRKNYHNLIVSLSKSAAKQDFDRVSELVRDNTILKGLLLNPESRFVVDSIYQIVRLLDENLDSDFNDLRS